MDQARLKIHQYLLDAVPSEYNLYFNPPTSIILTYPCVVYKLLEPKPRRANNNLYSVSYTFRCTVMTRTPGQMDHRGFLEIPNSSYSNNYVVEDIVHDIFDITIN